MAEVPHHPQEIADLLERSAASRVRLGREVAAVRQRLDAPAKVLRSVREHPLRWVGGAAATGLATALLFRRKPGPARKPRTPGRLLLSLAVAAAKPALKAWLTRQFKDLLLTQLNRLSQSVAAPQPAAPGVTNRRHPL